MVYEQRDNTGAIFKNDKKLTDKHPNMTGKGVFEGRAFWISGWTKEGPDGDKYISLSFKPIDGARPAPPAIDILDETF